MRIVLFCSSLAVGRDGVGDYVRRLGATLTRQGHVVGMVALHDAFADSNVAVSLGDPLFLRLSKNIPWARRLDKARGWLEAFRPEWVSIQFVCFGFHSKGLVYESIGPLRSLCAGYSVHWMFHELWVGLEQGQPWRFRPWGWAQRNLVLRLHRQLLPKVTHTSNQSYARELARHGIEAAVLPLPGSFPVTHETDWMESIGKAARIDDAQRGQWTVLGIFGAIQRQWLSEPWLEEVARWGERSGQQIALLGIGRLQGYATAIWSEAEQRYGSRVRIHHFGEQPTGHVVQFLRYIDYGVATGLASLVGKSSGVATMLEHRKTVLVPCWDLSLGMELIQPWTKVVQRCGLPAIEPTNDANGDVAGRIASSFAASLQAAM